MANEWSFRDFPGQDQQSTAMAEYAYDSLKLRKMSAIIVNDDYGLDGYNVFKEIFEKRGGTIVAYEPADQKDIDFRTQVLKVMKQNPEGIYVIIRDNALGTIVKQLRENGYKGMILGVNAFDTQPVWNVCKELGEGAIFSSSYLNLSENTSAKNFRDIYFKKYNEEPNYVAVYGYTIGIYLSDIARQAKGYRNDIRKLLTQLDVPSIRGPLKMNSKREVLSPIGIYKRTGNVNKLICVVPTHSNN
jgi:branched-chain amino acid transport system substrate-binding protein